MDIWPSALASGHHRQYRIVYFPIYMLARMSSAVYGSWRKAKYGSSPLTTAILDKLDPLKLADYEVKPNRH